MDKVADVAKDLPSLCDPKVTEFVTKYNQWAADMKLAATAGDANKLAELTKQSVDFSKELQGYTQSLTAEDAKKLQDWTAEIQKQLNN